MKLMRGTEFSHGVGKEEHGVMLHLCLVQQKQGLDERSTHSGDVIIHVPMPPTSFLERDHNPACAGIRLAFQCLLRDVCVLNTVLTRAFKSGTSDKRRRIHELPLRLFQRESYHRARNPRAEDFINPRSTVLRIRLITPPRDRQLGATFPAARSPS